MGTKISDFPQATNLLGDELVPIVQGNSTVKTTTDAIAARTVTYAQDQDLAAKSLTLSTTATTPTLKIEQLGTGDAFVVNPEPNANSTPFVIQNNGTILAGNDASLTTASGAAKVQITGDANPLALIRSSDTAGPINLEFGRAKASQAIVTDGLGIGRVAFSGSDGAAQQFAAYVDAEVDGAPATGSVPGRLIFRTTAVGGTGPGERLRINAAGRILTGGGTESTVGGTIPQIQIQGTATGNSSILGASYNSGTSTSPNVSFARSKATTVGSFGAVVDGDWLGSVQFFASTASAWDSSGYIVGVVDGSPTTTDVPMAIRFDITKVGGTSPSNVMKIDSSGRVGIGNTDPSAQLEVNVTDTTPSFRAKVIGGTNNPYLEVTHSEASGYSKIEANGTTTAAKNLIFATAGTDRLKITSSGNLLPTAGSASMINGFLCIPSSTAAATGTPNAEMLAAGVSPMYFDRTNFRLYIHTGTAWKSVLLA
jgi:hypothetical protein